MCSYCPQTQYIKKYKEIYGERHKLSYDTFLLVVDNIPLNTVIHWTGFTEPFACKDFPLIVSHLSDLGYKQIISTTLYGLKENQQFFIDNLELFSEGINLHLPDSSKLMKGKFTEKYLNKSDHLDAISTCNSARAKMVVAANGKILFCCAQDYNGDNDLGSLLDDGSTVESIWNEYQYQKTRKSIVNKNPLSICTKRCIIYNKEY